MTPVILSLSLTAQAHVLPNAFPIDYPRSLRSSSRRRHRLRSLPRRRRRLRSLPRRRRRPLSPDGFSCRFLSPTRRRSPPQLLDTTSLINTAGRRLDSIWRGRGSPASPHFIDNSSGRRVGTDPACPPVLHHGQSDPAWRHAGELTALRLVRSGHVARPSGAGHHASEHSVADPLHASPPRNGPPAALLLSSDQFQASKICSLHIHLLLGAAHHEFEEQEINDDLEFLILATNVMSDMLLDEINTRMVPWSTPEQRILQINTRMVVLVDTGSNGSSRFAAESRVGPIAVVLLSDLQHLVWARAMAPRRTDDDDEYNGCSGSREHPRLQVSRLEATLAAPRT